jgi:hypothetical protein
MQLSVIRHMHPNLSTQLYEMMTQDNITRYLLLILTIGVWIIVLQNFGILRPVEEKEVIVDYIRRGNVDVNGYLDVNLEAINGHGDVFFNNPSRGEDDKYYVIPVTTN